MAFDAHPERTAHMIARLALIGGRRAVRRDVAPMLVYLADRESISHYGHAIGDALHRIEKGAAVQAPAQDILHRTTERNATFGTIMRVRGYDAVLHDHVVDIDLDHLSQANEKCLDQVWSRFGAMGARELRTWMTTPGHLPEITGRTGGIPLVEIMRAVGLSDPEGQARSEAEMRGVGLTLAGLMPVG